MSKKLKVYDFAQIIDFLTRLSQNNNKLWFDENREEYQACRLAWIELAQKFLAELSDWEEDFFRQDPRKCIFRINRDIRFSKIKLPYKNNFGMYFVPLGKNSDNAGYYLHLEPGGSFVAAGRHSPTPEGLKKIRNLIADKSDEFESILSKKSLIDSFGEMEGPKLKRAPKGFDPELPNIERLKHKGFVFSVKIPDSFFEEKDMIEQTMKLFAEVRPFVEFLNRALKP